MNRPANPDPRPHNRPSVNRKSQSHRSTPRTRHAKTDHHHHRKVPHPLHDRPPAPKPRRDGPESRWAVTQGEKTELLHRQNPPPPYCPALRQPSPEQRLTIFAQIAQGQFRGGDRPYPQSGRSTRCGQSHLRSGGSTRRESFFKRHGFQTPTDKHEAGGSLHAFWPRSHGSALHQHVHPLKNVTAILAIEVENPFGA